jgi:hypothetical protein
VGPKSRRSSSSRFAGAVERTPRPFFCRGYSVAVAEILTKEAVSERLAEIRQQLALLADYL